MLQAGPQNRNSVYGLGWSYWELGETENAEKTFLKAQKMTGAKDKGITQLGFIYGKSGRVDEANECLRKLIEREKRENTGLSVDLTIIYTGLGQLDKVFEQLERAYENKHGGLLFYVPFTGKN